MTLLSNALRPAVALLPEKIGQLRRCARIKTIQEELGLAPMPPPKRLPSREGREFRPPSPSNRPTAATREAHRIHAELRLVAQQVLCTQRPVWQRYVTWPQALRNIANDVVGGGMAAARIHGVVRYSDILALDVTVAPTRKDRAVLAMSLWANAMLAAAKSPVSVDNYSAEETLVACEAVASQLRLAATDLDLGLPVRGRAQLQAKACELIAWAQRLRRIMGNAVAKGEHLPINKNRNRLLARSPFPQV